MSWFSDANCAAAALLEHAVIGYAVDFDFISGHVRLWTGTGDLTINSQTYLGVGGLGNIAGGPEKTQLVADQRTYSLAYVDPTTVPESEIDNSMGRSVTEYEVWIHPETRLAIGTEINWEGRMSKVSRRDGSVPMIDVGCENRLVNLEDADGWRYTTEHQAKFFSGDIGLDPVKELESVEIIWGGLRVVAGGVFPNLAHRILGR